MLKDLSIFLCLSLCLLALKPIKCDQGVKEKHVLAMVYSQWSDTPFLLEASEFLYRTNPNMFWPFVNEAVNSKFLSDQESTNNQSYYDELLQLTSRYISPLQHDLLRLSLSIRTFSPAIEMSRSLAENSANGVNCLTFVDVHGQVTCDPNEIQALVDKADINQKVFIYQHDKHYNFQFNAKDNNQRKTVVLYSDIGSREFKIFHDKLIHLASSNEFDYVLRHNYRKIESNGLNDHNKVALSGYGVELDIKSTEYKARDDTKVNANDSSDRQTAQKTSENEEEQDIQGFMINRLRQLNPSLEDKIEEFRKHLLESTLELAPLKAWQMQDLSLQAAQRIIDSNSADALSILEDLSQNYPVRARSLSKIIVKNELKKAIKSNRQLFESQLALESGAASLYLNGLELNIDTTDIFSLTSVLKKEAQLLESLSDIGLSLDQVREIAYLDTTSKNSDYGVDIRDSSIQWLNDLEKDSKYSYWGRNLQELLRPTYPGMMRSIAKNFYNLVFIVDPASQDTRSLLTLAESFYVNDVPTRIGFVFVTKSDDEVDGFKDASVALFRAHNYIKINKNSPVKALSFITDIYAKAPKSSDISVDLIVKEFKKQYPKEKNLDDVFGVDSDYDEGRKLTMEYYSKIGLKKLPQVLINGFPLSENEMEAEILEESIITKIMKLTPDIQMAVYKGELRDTMNLVDWLMKRDEIMPRLNARVLSTDRQYLDFNKLRNNQVIQNLRYLLNENGQTHLLTLWAICDPDTEKGRKFLYDSIEFYESSKLNPRLAILFQKSAQNENDLIKRAIQFALDNMSKKEATSFIKKILKEKNFNDLKSNKKSLGQLEFPELSVINLEESVNQFDLSKVLNEHSEFLKSHLPFKRSTDIGLIANGWIVGPFNDDETFFDSDFTLLENFMLKIGLKQIKEQFQKWKNLNNVDDLILMVNSMLGKYASSEKRVKLPELSSGKVNIKPLKENVPFYDIVVVLDPLSRQAQKISSILKVLTQTTNVNLVIYFNCKERLSAPPLKSFYRYVIESEVKFNNGKAIKPFAYFHNMPQSPILTMNIHSPESWMVEASNSPYDLDNICLKEIDSDGAYGEFELEHLIIEGHAHDVISGQPPRGLQFNLGTSTNPVMYDTIVMANLGYFQLKASPGTWILQLREGRSKDIYEVISHENTDSESKRSTQIVIVIDSFESRVIKVKVSKKAEKINENLLDDKDNDKDGGIWNSITTSFSGSADETNKEDVLNIFSVASGHLYERLLRIMMLTVLKNTQAKVKFWFLKNYLSPQFTRFLPYYAEKYKFDFELVQYKWPRWLHQQSEKQRIIWGYKILFLDVLFPLSVEKIIYVDADQIVRADLTELRDLDLKGAPYGYTPFCDSRKEMEGYRFWKSGYWQAHLGHRKYHISALYVVDLKKFRKIAAGDRLRGQYQGLSQDPNSLSNLDQDLPNNMIHQVNIFSLPQEWLYCDAWCSSDTLSKAKTIDLCNNPQTKEPKLEAAVRIVPEWKDFDNEIKNLVQQWQDGQKESNKPVITTPPPNASSSTLKDKKVEL